MLRGKSHTRVHFTFLRIAVVYMTGAWRRRSAMGDPVQQADEQRPSLPPPVHHWQHTAPLMVMVARPMARAAAVVVTGAPVAAGAPNQLVWPPRPPPLLASHPTSLIWQQLPPAVLSTNGVGAPPPPHARPPTAFSTTGRLHQQQYHPSVVGGGRQASPPSPPSMSDRARDVVEDMERMRQNKTAQNTQIIALFRAGVTVREIARRLDVHHSTIVRRLKRLRSTDDEVLADGDQNLLLGVEEEGPGGNTYIEGRWTGHVSRGQKRAVDDRAEQESGPAASRARLSAVCARPTPEQ